MSYQDSLKDLTESAITFRDERNWKQFHNPKDMALSLSIKVAELLELMQWKNGEDLIRHLASQRKEVGDELSDVFYWILLLASDLNIDLANAFREKLKSNKEKYPIDKARGSSRKYSELIT